MLSDFVSQEIKRVIQENISHANCYGVPRGLLEYRQSEREDILIVEKRSVAAYIYRNEIKEIIGCIHELINKGEFNNQYKVFNNFGFAKEFVMLIYFTSGNEGAEYQDQYTKIINGEAETAVISLYINPYHHKDDLLSQFLYHELNHCKDDIQRRVNNKPSLTDVLKQ